MEAKEGGNLSLGEMMEAGVHIGCQVRRWNPRMAPYILAERNGTHPIDLTLTARYLSEACDFVADAVGDGKQLSVVGTAEQAADAARSAAIKAKFHYVNAKWLGGMLTNWSTTEARLQRLKGRAGWAAGGNIWFPDDEIGAAPVRRLAQLHQYLGGLKYMKGLPDAVIIVDQRSDYTAIRECLTLGLPTVCLVDTDCDPDLTDLPIPANDDSSASIRGILNGVASSIRE